MEWHPIETAPVNKSVLLGRWKVAGKDVLEWETNTGVARRSVWPFGIEKTFDGSYYTHWKRLPDPPKSDGPR